MTLQRVVVVGASLAGLRAAETLRREGFDGTLTVVGDEPHLPYTRPPLSKQILKGEWEPERAALRPAATYEGWDLRLGRRAVALDVAARRVLLDGDEPLPFDGLVIATGASPRWPAGLPRLEGVHVLRTLDDCSAISAEVAQAPRVAVIGAGFIGAEVAATCRQRGLDVALIEALPVPLARGLGERMGAACAELHRDHGVALHLGNAVETLEGGSRVEAVRLADGSRVEADLVVVGVGVAPSTGWLEGSGLALGDGVRCDATGAAAPGVYAAGDVARWPHPLYGEEIRVEHWSNANEQGAAVARNLLHPGLAEPFSPVPWFWSDQYGTRITFVGRVRPDDHVEVARGSVDERRFIAIYGRDGVVVGALGFDEPKRVLGLHGLLAGRAPLADAVAAARAD